MKANVTQKTNTVSLLMEVGRVIRTRMERGLPLSFAQCETLALLEREEQPTMRTLVDHFKITAPSATAIINGLVRAGLVARAENAKDRREVHLRLTKAGKSALRAVTVKKKKVLASLLAGLTEHEREEFDKILSAILAQTKRQEKK